MDRYVNLNLNILMSSANKEDLREGFNGNGPHIPRASVWVQHKLFAEPSVNQRWSFSPVIEAASVSGVRGWVIHLHGGPQVVSNCQARPEQMTRQGCASGVAPRRRVPRLFCCGAAGVPPRPSLSIEACWDKTWCPLFSHSHVWGSGRRTEESLWGAWLTPLKKITLPHLGSNVSFLHFTAHRWSWVKPDHLMGRCHSSVIKEKNQWKNRNYCESILLKKKSRKVRDSKTNVSQCGISNSQRSTVS